MARKLVTRAVENCHHCDCLIYPYITLPSNGGHEKHWLCSYPGNTNAPVEFEDYGRQMCAVIRPPTKRSIGNVKIPSWCTLPDAPDDVANNRMVI